MKFLKSIWKSKFFKVGALFFLIGPGSLHISVIISKLQGDSNPNPVGPGILAMYLYRPSLILMGIGISIGIFQALKTKIIK